MQTVSLSGLPKDFKIALLRELGYDSDGTYVTKASGDRYEDPFSGRNVEVQKMMVLPGRSPPVIIEDSPLSLSAYLEEYGETFGSSGFSVGSLLI